MTREKAEKIARGITDKIECNTADMDDWAEFWGFTVEEYDEFLDTTIKTLEQEPKTGHWIEEIDDYGKVIGWHCDKCYEDSGFTTNCKSNFCPNCGTKMVEEV